MKAEFNLDREQKNRLFIGSGLNPAASFHFHSQIEIQLVHEGEVEVWVNDQHAFLKSGEISVAFSYDAHGYRTPERAKVTHFIIPTELFGEFLPAIRDKKAVNPFVRDPETYRQLNDCYNAIRESRNEIKKRGYLYVILGSLMERMKLQDREGAVDSRLSARILFYINEHFREALSLQSIASELGYNPGYLSRYFKACFNIGLNQYITMIRLREAVLLMREGKNSISYCAFESGFNSIRTFYRAFFEEFQCTPKEYLAAVREAPR